MPAREDERFQIGDLMKQLEAWESTYMNPMQYCLFQTRRKRETCALVIDYLIADMSLSYHVDCIVLSCFAA